MKFDGLSSDFGICEYLTCTLRKETCCLQRAHTLRDTRIKSMILVTQASNHIVPNRHQYYRKR